MNRKIIGLIIVFTGAVFLFAMVYFVLLGNSWSNFLSIFNSSDEQTKVTPISIDENTDQLIPIEEAVQKVGGAKRITIDDIEKKVEITEEQKMTVREFGKDDIKRMATSFAERFGTYSNQSNFANVLDLKIFMTRAMKNWADLYVADNRAIPQSVDIYYGITTRSVSEELLEYDDDIGFAKIAVSTRRQEASASRNNVSDIFEQKIEIDLKKENGAWKVDNAYWQDR